MTIDEFVKTYPRLFHMAHSGSWPSIRDQGLMSTAALLDAYQADGATRLALNSTRRPLSVPLARAGLPDAMVRDQKPMSDTALQKCLQDGLTPRQWYERLNSFSFFWVSASRVWRLLGARAYRDVPQTVLTLNTATLVKAHGPNILLSSINSGSTIMKAQPRGIGTFVPIADFPFAARATTRAPADNVVELVVLHSVPDVAHHVLAVHEAQNDAIISEIWRSPAATDDDHP